MQNQAVCAASPISSRIIGPQQSPFGCVFLSRPLDSQLWRFNCIAVEPVWQPLYFVQCANEFGAHFAGLDGDAKAVASAAVSQLAGQNATGVPNGS